MVLSTDNVIGSKPNYKSFFMLQRWYQVIDKENIIVEKKNKQANKRTNKNTTKQQSNMGIQ